MAGCPFEAPCFIDDKSGVFGFTSRYTAATEALSASLEGIVLERVDASESANRGRSSFFLQTVPITTNDLMENAEAIVCHGLASAPDDITLTYESEGLLEAAVSPPGCHGNCPRYQAYQGQG